MAPVPNNFEKCYSCSVKQMQRSQWRVQEMQTVKQEPSPTSSLSSSRTHSQDVSQFLDYRAFLLAHAEEQRKKNAQWSYGAWAKRLGMKQTATLTRILQGQRDPGEKIVQALVCYFKFTPVQADYFRDLVRLSKIKQDTRLTAIIMEKMGRRFGNSNVKIVDEATFTAISNWYYLAIREMIRLKNFREDPIWIAQHLYFHVSPKDVSQAIKVLLNLGLIARNECGELALAEGRLNTGDDISNEAVKRYHEEMLDNAKAALRVVEVEKREITCQTIAVSAKRVQEAKALIREFQDKFSEIIEDNTTADQLYQLQIQFFPLSDKLEGPY